MSESARAPTTAREPHRGSGAWQALVAAAAPGRFPTPTCGACEHRFYPPQSWCPRCLHDGIEHRLDDGAATVLSCVALHRSFAASWRERLPVHVARVRTASGVSLFALADGELTAGTAVSVEIGAPGSLDAGLLRVQRHPSLRGPRA